jgi:DNA-3-methyladenine glycosylase
MVSQHAGHMPQVVNAKEFLSCDTVAHARSLLGRILVRTTAAGTRRHLITEVEAYDGEKDLACHASKGRTARTEVMYQAGGRWYVYLCYGMHEMLNLVTGPADYPAAVLIRGVDQISGPGRLTRQLGIDRRLNNRAAHPGSGLHLENSGLVIPPGRIKAGPRIGVSYAGPVWAAKPWRFSLES